MLQHQEFLEYKYLVSQLWEIRDELICNSFVMHDIRVLLQLVQEIFQEVPRFQVLVDIGPLSDFQLSVLAIVTLLVNQIVEIGESRIRLYQSLVKYIVQANDNASDGSGFEVVLKPSDAKNISPQPTDVTVSFEIRPTQATSQFGITIPVIQKLPSKTYDMIVKKRYNDAKQRRDKPNKTTHFEPSTSRNNFSRQQRDALKNWLFQHQHNPFPTDVQKQDLCSRVGITSQQLNTWFVNNRKRLLGGIKNKEVI